MKLDKSILYILPVPFFFSQAQGIGGHVTHALGIIHAFGACGFNVDYFSEEFCNALKINKSMQHVYPMNSKGIFGRQLWHMKVVWNIRKLVKARNPQFCYMRYSAGFAPWIPIVKQILGDIPLVLEVNSFLSQRYRWGRLIDRVSMRSADLVTSVSAKNKYELLQFLGDGLGSSTVIVPNGVDFSRFSDSKGTPDCSCDQNQLNIGYLGTLKDNYGLDILIDSAREIEHQYDHVVFHIYGEGPYQEELQCRAADLRNVIFHGAVPYEQVPAIYRTLDVCVNTAHPEIFQNSPIKLFEYMATGKPIIHAATPQAKDILGEERCGLLYQWNDPHDLTRQIIRFIEDPGLASHLAYNARQEAVREHSWGNRVHFLLQTLRERGHLDIKK